VSLAVREGNQARSQTVKRRHGSPPLMGRSSHRKPYIGGEVDAETLSLFQTIQGMWASASGRRVSRAAKRRRCIRVADKRMTGVDQMTWATVADLPTEGAKGNGSPGPDGQRPA